MSELLENMILLCGEPELDGLNDPAARLRALIDGLITQRNRADAAEAEIARLRDIIEYKWPTAQPPAVGEDVVERAKAAVMEAYADYWGLSGDELPDNCAVAITDALIRSNLLRTKGAGHKPENS